MIVVDRRTGVLQEEPMERSSRGAAGPAMAMAAMARLKRAENVCILLGQV